MPRPISLVALCALALALVAGGCGDTSDADHGRARTGGVDSGRVEVVDATVTVPPNPTQAAVRMVIVNGTDADDTLLSASSPAAASVSIHRCDVDDEGRAVMEEVEELAVAKGSRVTFEPGGLHLMLEGLHSAPAVGETIPVELTFADAGDVTVDVAVVEPGTDVTDADESPEEHDHAQ